MRKSSANAAAAVAAVATTTTTTQQQVDPNNNNVIDNNSNHPENNNNNNNNDATTTTITATTVEGLYNVIDSKMKYIMIQNRELHQQNVEFKSTIKKQHDFIKIELQQMKHIMQRLIDGNGNQQQPSGPPDALTIMQEQPVLANDDDDNEADDNDDDGDGDQPSGQPAVSGSYLAFQLQQQVEEQRLLAISAASAEANDDNNSHRSNKTIIDYTTIPYVSTLSKHPKDLFQLWREYQYGLDGRKPAKLFTSRERGQVRFTYHRRKVIWDKIKEMKKIYKTSHIAIEELYRIYGGKDKSNISKIINQIKIDRRTKNNQLQPSATAAAVQHQSVVGGVPRIQQQQQPVRAIDENEDYDSDDTTVIDDGTTPYEATLSKRPKDLYQLWEEYQYGIDGRKPAKKFTSRDRGRVRFLYTRRKIVWDKIKELLKYEGHTYQTAIEEIYRIYGHDENTGKKLTLSQIENRMRKDRPPKIIKKKSITNTKVS